uniref:Uncharacterized protein n=1 Tax=Aegilops tauschii subsp. strangulata TaxID=200361 RepID=A0A453GQA7_AEGTS
MAKSLAVALLLLVVLAHCDGRELSAKDRALAGSGAGGVQESKASGSPGLPIVGTTPTGTSTINGPLVVIPGVPVHP